MYSRLALLVCCVALLIASGCYSSPTNVSLNEALPLATKELFDDAATAVEPIKMSLEIVETPDSWDFLFEWEPGSPGLYARILVSKKDGSVESLPGM